MSPETKGRLFDPAAAIDRLIRNLGDVFRTLKYSPTLVQHALVDTAIGLGMLGLAFLSEQSAPPDPQIPQIYYYDRGRTSAVNEIILGNAPLVIVVFVAIAVGFGCAAPWMDRKLTSWEEERKKRNLNP